MNASARTSDRLLLAGAAVQIKAAAGGKRPRFEIKAYSGGVMRVPPYGDIVVDLAGLEPLPESAPLLAEHVNSLDTMLGTGSPAIEDGELMFRGEFNDTEPATNVVALGKTTTLQASVGVDPLDIVEQTSPFSANGQTFQATAQRPINYVRRGRLRETSLVAIGADPGNRVVILAKGSSMNEFETWAAGLGIDLAKLSDAQKADLQKTYDAANPKPAVAAMHAGGLQAERARVAEVHTFFDSIPDTIAAKNSPAIKALLSKALADEISIKAAQGEVLSMIRASRTVGMFMPTGGGADLGGPQIVECAIMARLGRSELAAKLHGEQAVELAKRAGAHSLVDICKLSLQATSQDVPHDRMGMIRAAFSTGSLTNALSNVANKTLLDVYRISTPTWRTFCAVRPAADFKTQTSIRPSFIGDLQPLSPAGEIKHGTFSDAAIPWSVSTFAKMYRLTRTDIVNDSLGAFDELATALAQSGLRAIADLVYTVLMANAGSFFASGNHNVLTGGSSPLSVESLGAAIKQMRQQKDADNNTLDIPPTTLVVPPELEQTARSVINSTTVWPIWDGTASVPEGNPVQGAVALQVEGRLSNTSNIPATGAARFPNASTTAWYLFGPAAAVPMIVGFLQGSETPVVEFFGLESEPSNLGVSWRVFHDFGATLGDYRAAQRSAGA